MKFHYTMRINPACAAAIAALVTIASMAAGCKPVNESKAIAVFVVGRVTLERPNSGLTRQVYHKDEILQNDVIKTGPASLLVMQIGSETLIKIDADTTFTVASLFDKGVTKFDVDGTMFARARKLVKGERFEVWTKTSLAAVRGTEFSVSCVNGESVVAVHSGTVAVARARDLVAEKEEKIIDKGNAAVVKDTIATRPVTAEEQAELARFEKIKPVKDIDSATEAELKKLEESLMEGADKSDTDDSASEKNKETAAPEKKQQAEDATAKNMLIWTGKPVYARSDTIVVNYKNLPDNRYCWIDISKASDPDGSYQAYDWTYSATAGQMTFSDLNLDPGLYEVRVHPKRGSSVGKRFRFRVQ